MTEHHRYPAIANVVMFDEHQTGPFLKLLTVVAALTDSEIYPPTRITLCAVIGNICLTAQQAKELRDQLDLAIAAVVAACPELAP